MPKKINDTSVKEFMVRLVRQAGAIARKRFGTPGTIATKRHIGDVVTEVDHQINRLIVKRIRAAYPDHGVVSEEQDEYRADAEFLWIVDPLDGTRNFATGTPLFGVMIAFARRGVVQCSVIYEPMNERLYVARRGHGATLNGRRIHCSKTRAWEYSYGCGSAAQDGSKFRRIQPLLLSSAREPFAMNAFGCIAVSAAHVADGRRDWLVSIEASVWDYAAPALLLQESGCVVTNFAGKPWTLNDREFIVANPHLHKKLLRLFRPGRA